MWLAMWSKWTRSAPRCKTGAQILTPTQNELNTNVNSPCKPLSDTEDSEAHKDKAFDEDGGQCNLVWDHT